MPMPNPPRWTWLPLPRGTVAEPVARAWLADRLGTTTEALVLERDEYGRPQLGGRFSEWDCNWSHSGEGLLVALGRSATSRNAPGRTLQLGIDLEWLRPRPRVKELSRRFFTTAEADWLAGLADEAREPAFARIWCFKEAALKAHGKGLAFGLDRLEFIDTPSGLRMGRCDPALGDPAQWTLQELAPAAGYVGALAWRELPAEPEIPMPADAPAR